MVKYLFFIVCGLFSDTIMNAMEGEGPAYPLTVYFLDSTQKNNSSIKEKLLYGITYKKIIDGTVIDTSQDDSYLLEDYKYIEEFLRKELHWDRVYQIGDFIKKFPNHVSLVSTDFTQQEWLGGCLYTKAYTQKILSFNWEGISKEELRKNLEDQQYKFLLKRGSPIAYINTFSCPSLTPKGKKSLQWLTLATATVALGLTCRYVGFIPATVKK